MSSFPQVGGGLDFIHKIFCYSLKRYVRVRCNSENICDNREFTIFSDCTQN